MKLSVGEFFSVVIDRRKDHTADTGLFDLIYKQNYPRTPPYLGMNLSVRGRRIFRNRSKSKLEKEKVEKEKIILRLQKHDLIKINDNRVDMELPKILSSRPYNGPIIEDFMDEINKSVDKDSGVNFVPATKLDPPVRKRPEIRSERVSKYCSTKYKTNKSSLYRRQNVKENTRRCTTAKMLNSSRYVSVFRDWAIINKMTSEVSRLGTKNNICENKVANSLKPNFPKLCSKNYQSEIDININFYKNQDAFNLNKLLPHLKRTL